MIIGALWSGAAMAAEVNDLATGAPPVDYTALPLGFPAWLWWAVMLLIMATMVWGIVRSPWCPAWITERFSEPSTYLGIGCTMGFFAMFIQTMSLDPVPFSQGALLAAAVFIFLGVIGRDDKGPLI